MKEVSNLFLKFKNRADREESDCKVICDIVVHYHAGNKKVKQYILTWVFKRVENSKTIPIARNILIYFLYSIRNNLSKKKKKRLREVVKKTKTTQRSLKLFK